MRFLLSLVSCFCVDDFKIAVIFQALEWPAQGGGGVAVPGSVQEVSG